MPKTLKPILEFHSYEEMYEALGPLFEQAAELRNKSQDHLNKLLEVKQAVMIMKMRESAHA